MDKEAEIVAQKIESGDYYREGLSWFHSKFTGPRTEFSYVLIICLISLLSFFIAIASFSEIFPLSPGANFYISRPIQAGDYITIKPMKGEKANPNVALLNFLITEYVRSHDEYFESKIERNTRFIYTFSDNKTYQQFLDGLSSDNPQSPLLLYGQQANKEIKVTSVRLQDKDGNTTSKDSEISRATVNYQLALVFLSDSTEEVTNYQADISFQYKQITVDQKTGNITQKPELVVTGYTTKKLK